MAERDDAGAAELFVEYLEAERRGEDLRAAERALLERAGAQEEALRQRIRVHEGLRALSSGLRAEERAARGEEGLALSGRIGRFQLLERIGAGGLGRVYLAYDPELGRRVALKVIERGTVLTRNERTWILNEARALARLEHPGLVRVYEAGEAETCDFVAMEYLPGPSLAEVIAALARQRSAAAGDAPQAGEAEILATRLSAFSARIECLSAIAGALAYCHDHGVLHRDVKPANVLFDAEGKPRLIDFGLAHQHDAEEDTKLDLTQNLVGTAPYVAPEQVEHDRAGADPKSDQFSLAVLGYELFALQNPFKRETRTRTLDAIVLCRPRSLAELEPALPPDLVRVIHHGLSKDPDERYPGVAALADDLRAILEHRPIGIRAPSLAHLARLWFLRHRRAVALIAGVGLVLLAVLGAAWVTTALRERANVLERLSRIQPASFQGPIAFKESFQPLLELKTRARDFDQGWLRGRLWGGLGTEANAVVHAWSRALGERYERDLRASRASGLPFQELLYRRLFPQEEILCPECPYNLANRDRGRVLLPRSGLEGRERSLLQLAPLEQIRSDKHSVFRHTQWTDFPVPGYYRLRVWDSGGTSLAHEVDFAVEEGWPELQELVLNPRRKEFLERAEAVPFSGFPLQEGGELPVPAFRVLDHLVTVAEFQSFLEATGFEPNDWRNSPKAPPDQPAHVDLQSAMAFATWTGGRLPAAVELLIAFRDGLLPAPSATPESTGEYVLDLGWGTGPVDGSWFRYLDWAPDCLAAQVLGLAPTRRACFFGGGSRSEPSAVAFRVAFPDDHPETYLELEEFPISRDR
jgi:tRNA A-37 threonylcarbamoyl transferase component Bud32